MELKTVGEEEAEHFLLEKLQGLRVKGQLKRERRASVTRGKDHADFVEQEDNWETFWVPYRLFQQRQMVYLSWQAFHRVLKRYGSHLMRQGQAEEGVQDVEHDIQRCKISTDPQDGVSAHSFCYKFCYKLRARHSTVHFWDVHFCEAKRRACNCPVFSILIMYPRSNGHATTQGSKTFLSLGKKEGREPPFVPRYVSSRGIYPDSQEVIDRTSFLSQKEHFCISNPFGGMTT
ncbi:unnamed protein product [Sphagnum troendelagicum]|uniref:Uncharacterized protein n=1 Tax=Sphagnum troendelagicum TaxID=128251 RepID=A0ABP0UYF7_9BRYO